MKRSVFLLSFVYSSTLKCQNASDWSFVLDLYEAVTETFFFFWLSGRNFQIPNWITEKQTDITTKAGLVQKKRLALGTKKRKRRIKKFCDAMDTTRNTCVFSYNTWFWRSLFSAFQILVSNFTFDTIEDISRAKQNSGNDKNNLNKVIQ